MTPIYQARIVDQDGTMIERSIFFFSKAEAEEFAEAFSDGNPYYIHRYWVK